MLFDVRLSLRERPTGISTDVDIRLQVNRTPEGYEAYNPVVSPIVVKGATPQDAILNYLMQHLHREETLAFPKQ